MGIAKYYLFNYFFSFVEKFENWIILGTWEDTCISILRLDFIFIIFLANFLSLLFAKKIICYYLSKYFFLEIFYIFFIQLYYKILASQHTCFYRSR